MRPSCLASSVVLVVLIGLLAPPGLAEPETARVRNGGYLGMFFREEAPGRVVLERFHPGSGAEAAGLKAGDVVVAVNGIELDNADELIRRLWSPRKFTLNVLREGKPLEIRTSSAVLDDFTRVGEKAPGFRLPARDGTGHVALDDVLARGRPVVLAFGSFT